MGQWIHEGGGHTVLLEKNSVFIIIAGGLSRLKDIIATITSGFHWYFNCNLTELFYFLRKYR